MQSVGLRVQGFSAFRGLGFGIGVLFLVYCCNATPTA